MFVVAQDQPLAVRPDLEIPRALRGPRGFERVNAAIDAIQLKPHRALVGFPAGVSIDMDRERDIGRF